MTVVLYIILSTIQTLLVCVIIILNNYRTGSKNKEVDSKLLDAKLMFNVMELKGEIEKMTNKFDKLIKRPTKEELAQSPSLQGLLEATPTEEAYNGFVDMLLTKVADRYNKSFMKYFKAVPESDDPMAKYYTLEFRIEPEDLETFLAMNSLFVRHNLDKDEITKRVVERLPDFINLGDVKILHEKTEGLTSLSYVSSIAMESTISVFIAFIGNDDYDEWYAEYKEKVVEPTLKAIEEAKTK